MNLDVIAGVGLVVVLTAGLLLIWRRMRGPAGARLQLVLRVVCAAALSLLVVGGFAYWLMDSRTFQLAGELVSHVPTSERAVALTFDDGPSAVYEDEVLADLDHYHARGTFFVIGAAVRDDPQSLRRLVAAGEEIGNHTFTHPRLVGVSVGKVAAEVEDTDRVIRAAGYGGPILFRPPYCKKLVSLPYYLWRHDRTTVTWDLEPDSIDSLAGDPQAMTRYVVATVRPGSIILLHVWSRQGGASRRALPLILQALAARGFSFVTVSELLATR